MSIRSFLSGGLLMRLIGRELAGIRVELHQQNTLLARLADHFAPVQAKADPATLADTGYSSFDALEGGLVLDYIEKTERDTGRPPTEDEVLTFLADEKTSDLYTRMAERERELQERKR